MQNDSIPSIVLNEFMIEAQELVDEIEQLLVGHDNPVTLDLIFFKKLMRPLHTLKGSAGTVQRKLIAQLAHQFEDLVMLFEKQGGQQLALLIDLAYDWCACMSHLIPRNDVEITQKEWRPLYERMLSVLHLIKVPRESQAIPSALRLSQDDLPAQSDPETEASAPSRFKDHPLHFLSFMKGSTAEYTLDDIHLVSKLPFIQWQVREKSLKEFSTFLRETFKAHSLYREISRICLVSRVGLSNKLRMQSLAGIDMDIENTSRECFVNPGSTLFQIPPTHFRMYKSTHEVKDHFERNQRPPQKMMNQLAASGVGSGCALPIYIQQQNLGFLFLNSRDDSLSKLRPADYTILSYIQAMASLCLGNPLSHSYISSALLRPYDYWGRFWDLAYLRKIIEQHLTLNKTTCHVQIEGPELSSDLESFGNIAFICAQFAEIYSADRLAVKIEAGPEMIDWHLTAFEQRSLYCKELQVSTFKRELDLLAPNYKISDNKLIFQTNRHQGGLDQGAAYSVADASPGSGAVS